MPYAVKVTHNCAWIILFPRVTPSKDEGPSSHSWYGRAGDLPIELDGLSPAVFHLPQAGEVYICNPTAWKQPE